MMDTASRALSRLEQLRFSFGPGVARRKAACLDRLRDTCLDDSEQLRRLHEQLCFMRAYPDDRKLLDRVNGMLAAFRGREDLTRFRQELVNSGIAGTEVQFSFYWFTLTRLVERWTDRLRIDWGAFTARQRAMLDRRLSMLMPYCETLALEEGAMTTRQWIERLKGRDETDAQFLVRRFLALNADARPRELIFEEMDVPFRLSPGPDTPSSTQNVFAGSEIVFQKRPPVRSRETFADELERAPLAVRYASRGEAQRLLDMALTLMVTRTRDLDCFVHASVDDVRIVDFPEGFQLISIGSVPDRRQLFDAAYGFLMLRNGALIGYVLSASLFDSAEVAYNVSPEYRGAEAAHLYARCLQAVRKLFGANVFMVDPYQMGHGNPEGLKSGAWWFYYKLGFRPRDPTIVRLAEKEQQKTRQQKGYRSSIARLERLSSVNMYLSLGSEREDVIGEFSRENIGLRIVDYLAERFGAERERGTATCVSEVSRLLGLRPGALSPGERLALDRWAPVVKILPQVDRWPARDLVALARVIRAKGGRRESDFVRRFDRHRRLREAIFELSRSASG